MQIEYKYKIGLRIWVVYENNKEVCVYDDEINSIVVDENGLYYCLKISYEELKEEDIILYEDTDKLVKKIIELTDKINKEEK